MFNPRRTFEIISYLQYPAMLAALYYVIKPYFVGFDTMWENCNFALIFMGLGISLSTLQDTTRTQDDFSKRIWENPKKGKIFLILMAMTAVFFILVGFVGLYISSNEILSKLAIGIIVLGIGLIGMLKAAMELFENHRLDKKKLP